MPIAQVPEVTKIDVDEDLTKTIGRGITSPIVVNYTSDSDFDDADEEMSDDEPTQVDFNLNRNSVINHNDRRMTTVM